MSPEKQRQNSILMMVLGIGTGILLVGCCGIGSCIGIFWLGSNGNEKEQQAVNKQSAATPGATKPFKRQVFRFDYPAAWTVKEQDARYDPDHRFKIGASDRSIIAFAINEVQKDIILDEKDLAAGLAATVKGIENTMTGVTKTAFTRWGRYNGSGMTMEGRQDGRDFTSRVFLFNTSGKMFLVIEGMDDEEKGKLAAGFRTIEESFEVVK